MIKLFLLLALPLSLFASKILSYNIYDRTDRVDVMITFDTPYDGLIRKSISDSKIIIKLEGTSIESTKMKQLSSEYINKLSISSMSKFVQIVASVPQNIILTASKTSDAYGLRLRFTKAIAPSIPNSNNSLIAKKTDFKNKSPLSSFDMKKDDDLSQSYYLVVAILIVGILILVFIKKKINPKNKMQGENNWLFDKQKKEEQNNKPIISNEDVSIRFQKNLDEKNSVVMLDFADQSYLVMMGTSNVLLDRFTDNKPSTQEDFESILQDRHQALEDFLDEPKQEDPMQAYGNKASSISYQV